MMVSQRMRFPGKGTGARLLLTLLGVLLILAGCENTGDKPETAIGDLLGRVRRAYGGERILGSVSGFRAEAVLSEARNRRTGQLVLWYRRPDQLRMEYRYPEGGHLQILNRDRAWLGADDRSLEPADSLFHTSMEWEARCRGLPWSLLEDAEKLVLLPPDDEGQSVLRTFLEDGRLLDHHLDPKKHLVVRLILRSPSGTVLYRMDLGEFRRVRGLQVPFQETVSDRDSRVMEIRFRDVEIDPDFPAPLFEPGDPASSSRSKGTG